MDLRPQRYYFTTFCEKTKQKFDFFAVWFSPDGGIKTI